MTISNHKPAIAMKEYQRISAPNENALNEKLAIMVKNGWQLCPGCYQSVSFKIYEPSQGKNVIAHSLSVIMEREIPEKKIIKAKQPTKITTKQTTKGKRK